MSDNNLFSVLHDFKKSFLDDKQVLQDRIVEIETEIKECNMFIDSLNRKDDCDYNIFSPRSASRIYKDQVYEKKVRIEELEEELKGIYKKLSQVTKKLDSLDTINTDDDNNISESSDDNDYLEADSVTDSSLDNSQVEYTLDENTSDVDVNDAELKKVFLKMQEDDRQRIAAELHDSVLQNLSLLMHNLELSEKFIDIDPVRAKLEIASNRKIIKSAIEEMRNTVFDLRPMQFDDFGFKKSLENFLETLQSRTSIDIQYNIEDIDDLDNIVLLTIFRIVQELVNNAIKHSQASCIDILLLYDGKNVSIEVSDDGIGFNPVTMNKENHFGLKILNDRIKLINGEINYPNMNKGFKAVVKIPC